RDPATGRATELARLLRQDLERDVRANELANQSGVFGVPRGQTDHLDEQEMRIGDLGEVLGDRDLEIGTDLGGVVGQKPFLSHREDMAGNAVRRTAPGKFATDRERTPACGLGAGVRRASDLLLE